MKTISKRPSARNARRTPRKPVRESVSDKIARFAGEFMLKPGETGFDAVGELIKSRRAS
jgi:hypothetical protein